LIGLTLTWWWLLGLAVCLPCLGLITLTNALRSYSRRRLEERCDAHGRSELVDQVAHFDERTARASDALSIALGMLVAFAFSQGLLQSLPARGVGPLMALVILVLGVAYVTAEVVGSVFAEAVIEWSWPLAGFIRTVGVPLTIAIRLLERLVARLSGGEEPVRPASVEVEVPAEPEDSEDFEAELPEKARELLEHAVKLTRTDVVEIMTPATEIVSLPSTATANEAARMFRESGRSRIPVYGESRDDVLGILYAKDLFPPMTDPDQARRIVPSELVRPPFFIPESKNAFELLEELRARRTQIALILDEYGGVVGLITLEDLLEELVGVIDDEHDEPTPADLIRHIGGLRYEIDASLPIELVNERLELDLPTDNGFQTVAGLALHSLGRLPELGDSCRLAGVEMTVAEVAEHAIRRLILDLGASAQSENGR
jgi:CBS domain containing-hemolysin-like protein